MLRSAGMSTAWALVPHDPFSYYSKTRLQRIPGVLFIYFVNCIHNSLYSYSDLFSQFTISVGEGQITCEYLSLSLFME